MLKRKLGRASLFANGFVLLIASVNGRGHERPADSAAVTTVDPIFRQLRAFDSTFTDPNEFSSDVLANAPKIHLSSYLARFVNDYNRRNDEVLQRIKERSSSHFVMMDSIFT